jgi:cell wall-associated NlpC family hydrolase
MVDYQHLLSRSYAPGRTDCLGLTRDFFNPLLKAQSLPQIKNYARPSDFSIENVDLFGRHFHECGFRVIDLHPSQWRFGDVVLLAVYSNVASHVGVLVEDGHFIHHLLGQTSTKERYSGQWRQRCVGMLRHHELQISEPEQAVDITPFLPAALREKLANG